MNDMVYFENVNSVLVKIQYLRNKRKNFDILFEFAISTVEMLMFTFHVTN